MARGMFPRSYPSAAPVRAFRAPAWLCGAVAAGLLLTGCGGAGGAAASVGGSAASSPKPAGQGAAASAPSTAAAPSVAGARGASNAASTAGNASSASGAAGTAASSAGSAAGGASSAVSASRASVAAAASPSAAGKVVPFNYGLSTPSPETLLAWTAHTEGFDKQNGIDLSFVNAEGGSKGLQVLLSGQLQAMEVGLAPVVIANSQGADFRVIDSHANAIPFVMVGAKDMTPNNVAQKLKGKKIGISTFGSESDVSASIYLDKVGLVRDKDVAVVQVGGTASRLAALSAGAIAVAPLLRPDVAKAESLGFKPLLDLSKTSAWVFNAAVVSKPYLDAHRDVELGLVKSLTEGNAYARAHPDEAKKILQKELKYTDPKLAEAAYQEFLDVTPADTRPTTAGIQEVLKQVPAVTKGLTLKSTNPSDYVDLSLLDEIAKR